MGGRVSDFCGTRERRAFYGCGWTRVRGFVFRRYGRDDWAFAGCGGGCDCEESTRRHYVDAAYGRFFMGWRRSEATLWVGLLAICVDGDRREPVCDSNCAGDHATIEDSGLQLLLSRDRG